jgi:hypothetical protein
MRRAALLAIVLLSGIACGSARRSEPLVGAPKLGPVEQHGQILFHKFCHQCHPHGEAGLGPAINSNPAPIAAFRLQVRSGLGAMPSFPEAIIPDQNLDHLLAYVDALRDHPDE